MDIKLQREVISVTEGKDSFLISHGNVYSQFDGLVGAIDEEFHHLFNHIPLLLPEHIGLIHHKHYGKSDIYTDYYGIVAFGVTDSGIYKPYLSSSSLIHGKNPCEKVSEPFLLDLITFDHVNKIHHVKMGMDTEGHYELDPDKIDLWNTTLDYGKGDLSFIAGSYARSIRKSTNRLFGGGLGPNRLN